jgi:hypothetical protein
VRAALRHSIMQRYLPVFKSFISLATPHMGLLYSNSQLFSTGLVPVVGSASAPPLWCHGWSSCCF